MNVLIVDDNQDIRYTIKTSLLNLDKSYQFIEAASGEDCLKILTKDKPDIILMDVMMSGMDGIATTAKIKENPNLRHIKVIYLTAKTDETSKDNGLITGEDFIEKPFEAKDLDKRIKKIISKKSPIYISSKDRKELLNKLRGEKQWRY